MKKSIVYLGMALCFFTSVSFASNQDIGKRNKNGITALYDNISPLNIAIFKGDIETVKRFIKYGEDTNKKSNGMSPLMFAARYNKVAILQLLLSNGANPKIKDTKGFTALRHAELSNAKDAVVILKNM